MNFAILNKIAESRIQEAVERGELEDLAGKGQPLKFEDDSHLPPELRMAYKVLKNSGFTPPELDIRNEIVQAEDLLQNAPDEKARYKALKRLNYLAMKLDAIRPQSVLMEEHRYAERVAQRLTGTKKDK